MPQPTYQPQVEPQVQPSIDVPLAVTPAHTGALVAREAQGLAATANQIHLDEMRRANQTDVLNADNQAQAKLQALLYDPKSGILNQKHGRNAPGEVDRVLEEFDAAQAEIDTNLANDAQREQFRALAIDRRLKVQQQLDQYEHAETERYEDEVADATIVNAQTAAVQDPFSADDEVDKIRAVIATMGVRKGWSPEVIKARADDAVSATNLSVIRQLVSTGQDRFASAWYEESKDELTSRDASAAAELVKAGSRHGESRRIADDIIAGADSETKAMAALEKRNIEDTDVYDQTKARLRDHYRNMEAARDADENNAYDKGYLQLVDPANRQGLAGVDPALLVEMGPAHQQTIRALAVRPEVKTTDFAVWKRYDDVLSDPTRRTEALALRPLDDADKITTNDLQALNKRINDLRLGGADERLIDDAMTKSVIDLTMKLRGFPDDKPGSVGEKKAAQYQYIVRQDVAAQTKELGRRLTRDEVQKIADDNARIAVEGGWFTKEATVAEQRYQRQAGGPLSADEVAAFREALALPHDPGFDASVAQIQRWSKGLDADGFPDPTLRQRAADLMASVIPAADRQRIVAAYKAKHAGRDPDEATLMAVWGDWKKRTTPVETPRAPEPPAPRALSAPLDPRSVDYGIKSFLGTL